MKTFYPLILAVLFATSCSQKTSYPEFPNLISIHIIDRDGMTEAISNGDRLRNYEDVDFLAHQPYQKVLRVFERDCTGDVHAYITTYHANGQVRQYLEIVNNRAYGIYREWFTNGQIKIDAHVVEGTADINMAAEKTWLFDGSSRAYNECGNLIAEFIYCRGSLEGVSIHYHPNGTIWKEVPFKNNLICGELRVYLDNGDLLQNTFYENGIKSGKSFRFWPDGSVASNEDYVQGKLMSGVYHSNQGEIIAEINKGNGYRAIFGKDSLSELHEFHSGLPLGEVKVYNCEERIIKIYRVKNGLKHGEEIFYYEGSLECPLRPKISITWYEGKIQGLVKTWYDTQGMESQREMSENARNGVATAWYRDGQLMMIEEYENDRLKKGDYYRKGYKQPLTQVINGEGTVTLFDSEGNYLRKVPYINGKPDK